MCHCTLKYTLVISADERQKGREREKERGREGKSHKGERREKKKRM